MRLAFLRSRRIVERQLVHRWDASFGRPQAGQWVMSGEPTDESQGGCEREGEGDGRFGRAAVTRSGRKGESMRLSAHRSYENRRLLDPPQYSPNEGGPMQYSQRREESTYFAWA